MADTTQEDKWIWMMDYCEKLRIPPAQAWAWREAEEAYEASVENDEVEQHCSD